VVDVPIAKAMNWVGVEKPEVALKLFSSAGVPVTGMTKGGRISALRIEHVWTEVYLDYQNYRGVPTGPLSEHSYPLTQEVLISVGRHLAQPIEKLHPVLDHRILLLAERALRWPLPFKRPEFLLHHSVGL